MTRVLGIDVSLGRGLDAAVVVGTRVERVFKLGGPAALRECLDTVRPDAVAIDAPPTPGKGLLRDEEVRRRLAVPPAAGKHLDRRVAEYELSRRGIGSHQTHWEDGKLFSWMTAGFETFAAARAAGYAPYLGSGERKLRALEVFPYASYVALAGCLSPGRRWRVAWRRGVLERAGVRDVPEDATIDGLDAICAGLTGVHFLNGRGSFEGDPREGVIVVPVVRLLDRYKRCEAPEAMPVITTTRWCACGCGEVVRGEFRPGHDARHKARLWRDATAGSAAIEELVRRKWKLPPGVRQ